MDSARLFIAAPAPPELAKNVLKKQRIDHFETIKVVRPDQLHITLKFLGQTQVQDIPLIIQALNDASLNVQPFTAEAFTVRAMPERRPSVIAAQVKSGEINKLHGIIEDVLLEDELTLAESRQFSPHVTIARLKRGAPVPQEIEDTIVGKELSFIWDVDYFMLYESTLTKDGPEYSVLQTFSLTHEES